jgi:hypothetical protein
MALVSTGSSRVILVGLAISVAVLLAIVARMMEREAYAIISLT